MIRFVKENNKAIIFNDNVEENGWAVEYDSLTCRFLVWDNSERHASGELYSHACDSLEQVLTTVNSYT